MSILTNNVRSLKMKKEVLKIIEEINESIGLFRRYL
tara:strand:+ start:3206 stop:3313 length:108 start_codon:yes stop_codon:yes gene_type:complete